MRGIPYCLASAIQVGVNCIETSENSRGLIRHKKEGEQISKSFPANQADQW